MIRITFYTQIDIIWNMIFFTSFLKGPDAVISWDGFIHIDIYMNQYVTFIPDQQGSSLKCAHIVIGIDTADMFCFTFNCDDRNLIGSELLGWKRVT